MLKLISHTMYHTLNPEAFSPGNFNLVWNDILLMRIITGLFTLLILKSPHQITFIFSDNPRYSIHLKYQSER